MTQIPIIRKRIFKFVLLSKKIKAVKFGENLIITKK